MTTAGSRGRASGVTLVVLLACLLPAACESAQRASEAATIDDASGAGPAASPSVLPPVLLSGGAASLGSLGRVVVEAVGGRDTAALEALRLTEHEHNHMVFPRLPAGQPPQSFPVDIAWANIRTRNSVAVLNLFERYGGRELEFGSIECLGETQRFDGFEVATDCWTDFTDAAGVRYRAQLFRHAISADGTFKIFRYYD